MLMIGKSLMVSPSILIVVVHVCLVVTMNSVPKHKSLRHSRILNHITVSSLRHNSGVLTHGMVNAHNFSLMIRKSGVNPYNMPIVDSQPISVELIGLTMLWISPLLSIMQDLLPNFYSKQD